MDKKKLMAAAPLVAASFILLAGCGTAITSGVVLGKKDVPAHDITRWVPHYRTTCRTTYVYSSSQHGYTSSYSCQMLYAYSLPVSRYVPENWQLHIHNSQQDGWVSVNEVTYNSQAVNSGWQAAEGS